MRMTIGFLLGTLLPAASALPAYSLNCAKSFELVSWNVQTFGDVNPNRQKVIKPAYQAVFSTSVAVFAAQEIAHDRGLALFESLLPGGKGTWQASFENTPDSQDNGIFSRVSQATITSQGFLFVSPKTGKPDKAKAVHPVRWAHIQVDDFDFTLLSLHLTFQGGNAAASKKEFFAILDWLKDYLASPKYDSDIIIAGDYNLPSEKGKPLSQRSKDSKWIPIDEMIKEHGVFAEGPNKLIVLVDEPTSRPQKKPANNYDHFTVTESAYKKLLSVGRASRQSVDSADAKKPGRVSDHYPIEAVFCSKGEGISLDEK